VHSSGVYIFCKCKVGNIEPGTEQNDNCLTTFSISPIPGLELHQNQLSSFGDSTWGRLALFSYVLSAKKHIRTDVLVLIMKNASQLLSTENVECN
jgi:uncharacterized FAD-dependent dehydrogenase